MGSRRRWVAGVAALSLLCGCRRGPDVEPQAERAGATPSATTTPAEASAEPDPLAAVGPEPAGPLEPVPADTLIQLERTACFGDCPTYSVSIQADGAVVFSNKGSQGGCAELRASRDEMAGLVELIRKSSYFQLKASYRAPVTDHPSARTSVTLDGKTHRIHHYLADEFAKGPELEERKRLTAIEERIDLVAKSKQWLKRAASLRSAILYTPAQIEAVAAKHAARLAADCFAYKGTIELGLTIDGDHTEADADYQHWWQVGKAAGVCSIVGDVPRNRDTAFCACKQIMKWTFPPGCGSTEVRLHIDFGADPPKITADKTKPVPRTRLPPPGRGRPRGGL